MLHITSSCVCIYIFIFYNIKDFDSQHESKNIPAIVQMKNFEMSKQFQNETELCGITKITYFLASLWEGRR